MNLKNKFDQYVESRLSDWGEWMKKGCNSGVGFPHRNIIARLQEEGGLFHFSKGSKTLACYPPAEEIESLIVELFKQRAQRAKALRIYYFYSIEHELMAKKHGFTKTNYYSHLKLGREWIKGCLYIRFKNI